MTGNARHSDKRAMRSSARPSAKNSCSASPERFSNGRTAIAGRPPNPGTVGVSGDAGRASRARRIESSSFRTSFAVWMRWSGSFSRQRATIRSRSPGMSRRTLLIAAGESRRIAVLTSMNVLPGNGLRPAVSSYSTTPNANRSARASILPPSICSGAMYGAVPISRVTITFPGFDGSRFARREGNHEYPSEERIAKLVRAPDS